MTSRFRQNWGDFHAANIGLLRRFVARRIEHRQDIDDVVQESFARFLNGIDSSRAPSPQGYLLVTAKNVLLNNRRRDYIRREPEDRDLAFEQAVEASVDAERQLIAKQRLALLREAFAQLPQIQQDVIVMRQFDKLSYKDIAERTGLSVSSIEKHVRTGLLSCKAYLREREDGDSAESDDNEGR